MDPDASYIVAIDFEAAGGVPSIHGFTELGAVLMSLKDGKILAEFNEFTNMDGYCFEERCLNEFWRDPKNADVFDRTLKGIAASKHTPIEVIAMFNKWLKQHTAGLKDVYMISDNVGFDGGVLKQFSLDDTMYLFGPMREIVDVTSYYLGLAHQYVNADVIADSSKKLALKELNKMRAKTKLSHLELPKFEVTHDHRPVNDAKVMAWYWKFFLQSARETYADAPASDSVLQPSSWKHS